MVLPAAHFLSRTPREVSYNQSEYLKLIFEYNLQPAAIFLIERPLDR